MSNYNNVFEVHKFARNFIKLFISRRMDITSGRINYITLVSASKISAKKMHFSGHLIFESILPKIIIKKKKDLFFRKDSQFEKKEPTIFMLNVLEVKFKYSQIQNTSLE